MFFFVEIYFVGILFLFKIESDIEQNESVCSDDKSNVNTDDEFYNELMSAPAEYEDHLSKKNKLKKIC
jgi:hypothetical protein